MNTIPTAGLIDSILTANGYKFCHHNGDRHTYTDAAGNMVRFTTETETKRRNPKSRIRSMHPTVTALYQSSKL